MKTCRHCKTEHATRICPKCFKAFKNFAMVVPIHKLGNKEEGSQ